MNLIFPQYKDENNKVCQLHVGNNKVNNTDSIDTNKVKPSEDKEEIAENTTTTDRGSKI